MNHERNDLLATEAPKTRTGKILFYVKWLSAVVIALGAIFKVAAEVSARPSVPVEFKLIEAISNERHAEYSKRFDRIEDRLLVIHGLTAREQAAQARREEESQRRMALLQEMAAGEEARRRVIEERLASVDEGEQAAEAADSEITIPPPRTYVPPPPPPTSTSLPSSTSSADIIAGMLGLGTTEVRLLEPSIHRWIQYDGKVLEQVILGKDVLTFSQAPTGFFSRVGDPIPPFLFSAGTKVQIVDRVEVGLRNTPWIRVEKVE